jgi:hypothetical protein
MVISSDSHRRTRKILLRLALWALVISSGTLIQAAQQASPHPLQVVRPSSRPILTNNRSGSAATPRAGSRPTSNYDSPYLVSANSVNRPLVNNSSPGATLPLNSPSNPSSSSSSSSASSSSSEVAVNEVRLDVLARTNRVSRGSVILNGEPYRLNIPRRFNGQFFRKVEELWEEAKNVHMCTSKGSSILFAGQHREFMKVLWQRAYMTPTDALAPHPTIDAVFEQSCRQPTEDDVPLWIPNVQMWTPIPVFKLGLHLQVERDITDQRHPRAANAASPPPRNRLQICRDVRTQIQYFRKVIPSIPAYTDEINWAQHMNGHPNCAEYVGVDKVDGQPSIVTKYYEKGQDPRIFFGQLPDDAVFIMYMVSFIVQQFDFLVHAMAVGFTPNDLKPANVLIVPLTEQDPIYVGGKVPKMPADLLTIVVINLDGDLATRKQLAPGRQGSLDNRAPETEAMVEGPVGVPQMWWQFGVLLLQISAAYYDGVHLRATGNHNGSNNNNALPETTKLAGYTPFRFLKQHQSFAVNLLDEHVRLLPTLAEFIAVLLNLDPRYRNFDSARRVQALMDLPLLQNIDWGAMGGKPSRPHRRALGYEPLLRTRQVPTCHSRVHVTNPWKVR